MLGVADLRPLAVDLPAEFHGPVDYSARWVWLALLALALVALYYAAALWFTRERPVVAASSAPETRPDVRLEHLARIDAIEAAARSGALPMRDAHQQLSEVVRAYVERVTPLAATTMTLADFRLRAPRPLVEMIEVIYPPEFAPDRDGEAVERFDQALHRARGLVTTWRR